MLYAVDPGASIEYVVERSTLWMWTWRKGAEVVEEAKAKARAILCRPF